MSTVFKVYPDLPSQSCIFKRKIWIAYSALLLSKHLFAQMRKVKYEALSAFLLSNFFTQARLAKSQTFGLIFSMYWCRSSCGQRVWSLSLTSGMPNGQSCATCAAFTRLPLAADVSFPREATCFVEHLTFFFVLPSFFWHYMWAMGMRVDSQLIWTVNMLL